MISSKALVSPAKYRSISSTSGSGLRAAIGIEASNVRSMCNVHSPPLRGGVDAPSEAKAQTGWSDRRNVSVELTTPARQLLLSCRATPPLRGGECSRFHPRLLEIAAFHKRHRRQINVALKGLADLLIR